MLARLRLAADWQLQPDRLGRAHPAGLAAAAGRPVTVMVVAAVTRTCEQRRGVRFQSKKSKTKFREIFKIYTARFFVNFHRNFPPMWHNTQITQQNTN